MYVLVERFFMSVRGHVCVSGKVFYVNEGSCMC
jgi:hypothetical protein